VTSGGLLYQVLETIHGLGEEFVGVDEQITTDELKNTCDVLFGPLGTIYRYISSAGFQDGKYSNDGRGRQRCQKRHNPTLG